MATIPASVSTVARERLAAASRLTVYDSAHRLPPMVEELVELARFRDLVAQLIVRNITTRYKRSVLGVAWTLLNPLLTMLVLTVAFSNLFHTALKNYPVYVLTGLLFWNFFSQSTTTSISSLVFRSSLLRRIYIPHTIYAVSSIGSGLVNWLLALIPLAGIMLLFGHPFQLTLLFLPIAMVLAAMFTLGVSLLVSTLAVFFTDVIEIYEVLLRALLYLTAIMYPRSILPSSYGWVLDFNPIYHLLEMFRAPIYDGQLPSPFTILFATASAVLALAGGWWVFCQRTDEFAYRV
jgi:ABC-type polysaccharide/polyol phosphate export permease